MKALKESGPNPASKLPYNDKILSIKSVEVYRERMNKIIYNNGITIYSPPGKEKMLIEATFNIINKMPVSMQPLVRNQG